MAGLTVSRILPGPAGAPGAAGADATSGINSFTTTTADFTMPAVGANVTVTVVESGWMSPNGVPSSGQIVHVQNAGHMLVVSLPDSTHATLQNPTGYSGNATAATNIPTGSKVSPSGVKGEDGADGTVPTINEVSPTTTKGDILVDNGANNPLASVIRMAAGTNGHVLHSDSTQASGRRTGAIDLTGVNTALSGQLPVANGGTGSSTAGGAAANLSVLPLAGGTLTAALTISSVLPEYKFNETDQALDEKRWTVRSDGSDLKFQTVSDDEAARVDWLKVERTGTVVDQITIGTAAAKTFVRNTVASDNFSFPTLATPLVNGANNNITPGYVFNRITGPTAAFSVTGIAGGGDGVNGRMLVLYNTVAFDLTIANENAGSTALNRILTLTGADVTLTGVSLAWFIYDTVASRWILIGTQG